MIVVVGVIVVLLILMVLMNMSGGASSGIDSFFDWIKGMIGSGPNK